METLPAVLFYVFAGVALVASLVMVGQRNPIVSAFALIVVLCSLSAIYGLLGSPFIAVLQIVVYAGAIMVLFLFVIMYLNLQHDVETGAQIAVRRGIGWMVGALLLLFGLLLANRGWSPGPVAAPLPDPGGGNAAAIGRVLYSRFLFPFEVTSVLLLVAMVGAIVLAKGRGPADSEAA